MKPRDHRRIHAIGGAEITVEKRSGCLVGELTAGFVPNCGNPSQISLHVGGLGLGSKALRHHHGAMTAQGLEARVHFGRNAASVRTGAWVEYMPWWDVLFTDPPQPRNGMFHLGDAPGLGLTLDENAIKRFSVG